MNNTEKEHIVFLINDLIEQAVKDGGDSGGAYHGNEEELVIAVNNLLKYLNLDSDYTAIIENFNLSSWSNVRIINKRYSF